MLIELIELIQILSHILIIVLPLFLIVAYLTLAERKVIASMQSRIGPNRVGWFGLLQPIADVLKLLSKEVVVPDPSNRYLFVLAPILSLVPALIAWSAIPFSSSPISVLANMNAGVLFVFAMSSLSVYGILVAGWASNSKYAFLGALRSTAQTVSYEIAMGFCLVGVLLASQSMNITQIVQGQSGGLLHWYIWPLFPLFIIFWISGVAETNRAPFDLAEGESEIVAGFHVEYSGVAFAAFFLSEYISMIFISALISLLFLGGWHPPFDSLAFIPEPIWLALKMGIFLFFYLWLRATLPRYRYDQLMHLGWKVFIPITLVFIVIAALMVKLNLPPWFN